jgi:CHAT domain-containing protein
LRASLDTEVTTLSDIPAFDTTIAYRLYAGLLDPVKAGWQGATNLLVVANGALGELPFGLLVTQNTKPTPEATGALPFADYRAVPWLIRQLAVTDLPSVTSLTTLRAMPVAAGNRKPFIGFGDPWFSAAEAAQALAQQQATAGTQPIATRGAPVHLRSAPKTQGIDTAELAELPRLPDTADEVREVAVALKADPVKDVYLGAQANEQVVRSVDLADRRVIMFATHGLVPGDLDGLTEPALALTAPEIAKVPGDGLLTVSKILGLRLNADWVVLSACNTASGGTAGADAVSGLGLAFFYAGSRALLVSNWPVETTSARLLTTDLFKREGATPGITRAEALRQAMLALIDGPGMIDPTTWQPVSSYAHPLFWAPFSLVGDGAS